jgi:acyl dehydratase
VRLPDGLVGARAGPCEHRIDARWLMAYAAALGDDSPEYLDTTRPEGLVAHPLFPVCYEWPLALALRAATLGDDIAVRGVHATHDLTLHRPARAGDRLSTTAVVVSAEPRTPGAYVITRFETVDADGLPVSITEYGSLYRGVECAGAADGRRAADRRRGERAPGPRDPAWTDAVAIAPTLAHVYSECARIWNPIHTDRAVARSAGLPDIILHGTASLALAVSRILSRERAMAAARVKRLTCRFSGMVRVPSTVSVQGWDTGGHPQGRAVGFRVLDADGRVAVDDGSLVLTG